MRHSERAKRSGRAKRRVVHLVATVVEEPMLLLLLLLLPLLRRRMLVSLCVHSHRLRNTRDGIDREFSSMWRSLRR